MRNDQITEGLGIETLATVRWLQRENTKRDVAIETAAVLNERAQQLSIL